MKLQRAIIEAISKTATNFNSQVREDMIADGEIDGAVYDEGELDAAVVMNAAEMVKTECKELIEELLQDGSLLSAFHKQLEAEMIERSSYEEGGYCMLPVDNEGDVTMQRHTIVTLRDETVLCRSPEGNLVGAARSLMRPSICVKK